VRKKDFKHLREQINELKNTLGASKFNLDASQRKVKPNTPPKTNDRDDATSYQPKGPDPLLAK
jgi:hypothetical protein